MNASHSANIDAYEFISLSQLKRTQSLQLDSVRETVETLLADSVNCGRVELGTLLEVFKQRAYAVDVLVVCHFRLRHDASAADIVDNLQHGEQRRRRREKSAR
jgi:hypothetical protein